MTKPISLQQWLRQTHKWRVKTNKHGMPLLPVSFVWRLKEGKVKVDCLDFDGSIGYSYQRTEYFLSISRKNWEEDAFHAGSRRSVSRWDPPTARKVKRTAKKIVRKMMKYSDLGDLE